MLNHYETVFITTPVLSEQQIKEAVEKFKNTITDNGGTIEHLYITARTHLTGRARPLYRLKPI